MEWIVTEWNGIKWNVMESTRLQSHFLFSLFPFFLTPFFALCVLFVFLLRTPCLAIAPTPEKKSIDFAEQKGCY